MHVLASCMLLYVSNLILGAHANTFVTSYYKKLLGPVRRFADLSAAQTSCKELDRFYYLYS